MKKTAAVLLGALFLTCLVITASAQQPKAKAPELKTFAGSISNIVPGDVAKKTQTTVTVQSSDKTTNMSFVLMASTTIIGPDGKPMTADKLKVGDKVEVKYRVTARGTNQAVSIKVLP